MPQPLARSSLPARDPAHPEDDAALLWRLWLAWAVFIVYGSLVPLEFRSVPFDTAWQRLVNAPMLNVGVGGRADWVANGVLYFPFGLLACATLSGARAGLPRRMLAALASWLMALALAFVVELAQAYFPPRTVSRNDLIAEAAGSLLGALAGLACSNYLRALLGSVASGGAYLRSQLGMAYALGFAALAMFPFDFLLSADEWADKLHGSNVAWLLSRGVPPSGLVSTLAKLAAETLAALPLGAWWASRVMPQRTRPGEALPIARALLYGALLGLGIELLQLTISSGVSQGLSILTRALGFAAGLLAWQHSGELHVETLRATLRRATLPILLLYLPLLVLHHSVWSGRWLDIDTALHRLDDEVHFVPFYYHYFTTEMRAVSSLVAAIASYAPVGVLCWAWHIGARTGGVMAAVLALMIESLRLMSPQTRPDPTNLLIAAFAGWAAHRLLSWFVRNPARADHPDAHSRAYSRSATPHAGHRGARR